METILIAGGSGTIGTRLSELLLIKGYNIIVLSRQQSIASIPELGQLQEKYGRIRVAHWNIKDQRIDENAITQADYIINLAGAGIADKRWTDKRKKEIFTSRTESCSLLIKGLSSYPNKVKAVISASAIGWYGEDKSSNLPQGFSEDMPAADDYLGNTCKAWEDSIAPVNQLGIRLVVLRTGIVLSKEGGAFLEFKKPLRFRLATILGTGRQVISWIHEDDMCNIYIHALENKNMSGIFNAVTPQPVSNRHLISVMAKQQYGNLYLPLYVPSFALKITLGEMSQEVLKSTTVSSAKLAGTGFMFQYPDIENAVKQLLNK